MLDLLCDFHYIFSMQVTNPLVPAQLGTSGGAPALVANAPFVPDTTRHETSRPVTGSRESDRPRSQDGRAGGERQASRRGGNVDLSV